MTVQYKWGFPALDVTYSSGDLQNVVTAVHWTMTATDGEFSAYGYGSIGVGEPTPEEFVSYEDITEEEVVSWVESAMGEESVQALKDSLVSQIEAKKAPVSAVMTPPWNASPVTQLVVDPTEE